jgi:hypothetical protein
MRDLADELRGAADDGRGDGDALGLEMASLSLGEIVSLRDRQALERRDRALDAVEPRPELGRERPEGGPARPLGPHDRERPCEEVFPLRLGLGRPEGGQETLRLAHRKAVALARSKDPLLLAGRERGEGGSEREREPLRAEEREELRREARRDRIARLRPAGLAPEEPRGQSRREPVLVHERAHDPRLVERRDARARPVREEELRLLLGRAPCLLDDRRDLDRAGRAPAGEPLEAVQDLERPVGEPKEPERERRKVQALLAPRARAAAAAEPGQARS